MAQRVNTGFDVSAFPTFAAFEKSGQAFLAKAAIVRGSVAKVILAVAVLHAVRHPQSTVTECAEVAMTFASYTDNGETRSHLSPASQKQYPSQLKGAISYARAKALLPDVPQGAEERDTLAMVEAFVSKHSLDTLYNLYRAPQAQKREEAQADAKAKRETAQKEARAAYGVKPDFGLDVLKLQQTLAPFQDAAAKGDMNARRVLLALAASIEVARQDWAKDEAPALPAPKRKAA